MFHVEKCLVSPVQDIHVYMNNTYTIQQKANQFLYLVLSILSLTESSFAFEHTLL